MIKWRDLLDLMIIYLRKKLFPISYLYSEWSNTNHIRVFDFNYGQKTDLGYVK